MCVKNYDRSICSSRSKWLFFGIVDLLCIRLGFKINWSHKEPIINIIIILYYLAWVLPWLILGRPWVTAALWDRCLDLHGVPVHISKQTNLDQCGLSPCKVLVGLMVAILAPEVDTFTFLGYSLRSQKTIIKQHHFTSPFRFLADCRYP